MAIVVDPHENMRVRDVNKVARGEQAPRPAHEYDTVSPPLNYKPKYKSATLSTLLNKEINNNNTKAEEWKAVTTPQTRRCYPSYVQYHKCIREKGKNAPECNKYEKHYRAICPVEWIQRWDRERELATFPV